MPIHGLLLCGLKKEHLMVFYYIDTLKKYMTIHYHTFHGGFFLDQSRQY